MLRSAAVDAVFSVTSSVATGVSTLSAHLSILFQSTGWAPQKAEWCSHLATSFLTL
jgi:hypothetical protein